MIPVAEPDLNGNELAYVKDCVKSGWISSAGGYIKKFEDKFAEYCQVKYATSTSNGTTALHLALSALGIKEGDEVIMPNLTFIATANTVRYCGATPVFIDIDEKTWNIDPSKIEEKITDKTKAIIPVHLYGNPCDMDAIIRIAKKHNLLIIEDCAEATGAEYKDKKVGSFGDIACFSFYGNKIITTGEGGMCVTNSKELIDKMNLFKNHGMNPKKRYWHDVIGFNYRMTNIQAAIGLAQLERIEEFIKIRRQNASFYNSLLRNIKGIQIPIEKEGTKNVYWMYCIVLEENANFSNRDELMNELEKQGIDSRPFFYTMSKMPPYMSNETIPVSEKVSSKGINLPSSTRLTQEEIAKIAKAIKIIQQ